MRFAKNTEHNAINTKMAVAVRRLSATAEEVRERGLVKGTRSCAGLSHSKRRTDCFCDLQARPSLFSAGPKSALASSCEPHMLLLHNASLLRIGGGGSLVALGINELLPNLSTAWVEPSVQTCLVIRATALEAFAMHHYGSSARVRSARAIYKGHKRNSLPLEFASAPGALSGSSGVPV